MHRFFVPEENRTENEIVIHGDDVNHIRNVLRMTKGEKIMVPVGKVWIMSARFWRFPIAR